MTDEELDDFLISTLKKILTDVQECAEYVKNLHTREYKEIQKDYAYVQKDLTKILKHIKTIDDLAQMKAAVIDRVYTYIESYTDNFVVSNNPDQKQTDLAEYSKLEELLNLFIDSDDDEEETNFDENDADNS